MLREDQAAKSRNGRQAGNKHRLARAVRQDVRPLLLGKTVQNVDAVRHADAQHERQGHDIRRIEGHSKKAHQPAQPDRADRHGQQGEQNGRQAAKVDDDQQDDGTQRIQRRLLVTFLQQFSVFQQLHRGAGDVGINRPQLIHELFLVGPLPDILLGINLEQIFSRQAHKPGAERRRQILHPQRRAVVLVAQDLEGFPHVVEERLLIFREFLGALALFPGVTAQHLLPHRCNRVAEGEHLPGDGRLVGADVLQRRAEITIERIKCAAQFANVRRPPVGVGKLDAHQLVFDFADQPQLPGLVAREIFRHGDYAFFLRHRRQVGKPPFQGQRFLKIGGDDRAKQNGFAGGVDELVFKFHGGQALALHVQQVVIKEHFRNLPRRQSGHGHRDEHGQLRTGQPEVFNLRPPDRFLAAQVIQHVLPAAQHQHRQQRHHRDQADQQAAAADDAHLLDALEVGQPHREKRPGRRERAGENPLPGEHHRLGQRRLHGFAVAQFLLVARDQMHAKINRQPDQHRQESDRQNVQMPDHQRGKREGVGQSDDQADRRLDGAAGFVVAVDENQRADDQ